MEEMDLMKKFSGLLGVLAIAAFAPLAHANYQIAYQIGAGAITPCLNNPDSTNTTGTPACSGSGSGISIVNLTGSSNSPGTPGIAMEFSSSGSLTNNNATGAVTISVWFAAQGFTMPVTGGGVTAINYVSNSSGTSINTQALSTLGLRSCVDESATGGVGANFCVTPAASLTNTTLTYPAGLGGAVNDSVKTSFSPLTSPYVLSQLVTISLQAGDSVNFSMSQALTPVPEPTSIVLLGGVLLATVSAIRRKRNQAV
jgi:hypothetical protein